MAAIATMDATQAKIEFQAERDRVAQRLADLQSQLNARTTKAADLAALPGEIATTQAALDVLDARLIQADIDELDQTVATIEQERLDWRATMRETEPAAKKSAELANRLGWLLSAVKLDDKTQAELELFLRMAAEALPAIIRYRYAGDADRGCMLRINALREKRAGLVRQQQRNGRS